MSLQVGVSAPEAGWRADTRCPCGTAQGAQHKEEEEEIERDYRREAVTQFRGFQFTGTFSNLLRDKLPKPPQLRERAQNQGNRRRRDGVCGCIHTEAARHPNERKESTINAEDQTRKGAPSQSYATQERSREPPLQRSAGAQRMRFEQVLRRMGGGEKRNTRLEGVWRRSRRGGAKRRRGGCRKEKEEREERSARG
eukprot:1557490-Rhodomonas_salina.2